MQSEADLWGGTLVPKQEAWDLARGAVRSQKKLVPELYTFLEACFLASRPSHALLWQTDLHIAGDWRMDRNQRWINRHDAAAVVCLGDLTIDGDLLSQDDVYWPLLFVAGDLRVRNLLRSAPPIAVLGNVHASGYMVARYNDGPTRIGGDLVAEGYIQRQVKFRDLPQMHVIGGAVRARGFFHDLDKGYRRAVAEAFVPEVISEGDFHEGKILERQHAGLPVWRSADDPLPPEAPPRLHPPDPILRQVDPAPLGIAVPPDMARDELCAQVAATVVGRKDGISAPSFLNRVHWALPPETQDKVLKLPAGARLCGDLKLDRNADWSIRGGFAGIMCAGDLTIDGDILNRDRDNGPMLFVAGTLRVTNLLKRGAPIVVLGNLEVSGIVMVEYNHGWLAVWGDLSAELVIKDDHDLLVGGTDHATRLSSHHVDLPDVLAPELFEDEEDTWPSLDRVWSWQRAGLPLLKPDGLA